MDVRKKRKALEAAERALDAALQESDDDAELRLQCEWADDEYRLARDTKWLGKARRLEIPVSAPSDSSEMWERSNIWGHWLFSDKGFSSIRAAVRREQRDSYETAFRWGVLLIGVVGAISGLLAVLTALRS